MSKSSIVLGYYDSLLREEDIELLEENKWLNDNLIGFLYEFYEYDKYKEFSEDIFFVNPSFVQLLKFSDVCDLESLLEPWFNKSVITVPINNNNEKLHAGGTHWSLLVIYPKEKRCYHLDSAGHCNQQTARLFAEKICQIFDKGRKLEYIEALSAQQHNAYDCGIYVISNTELVCDHYIKHKKSIHQLQLENTISPQNAIEKRKEIKSLIKSLSKK